MDLYLRQNIIISIQLIVACSNINEKLDELWLPPSPLPLPERQCLCAATTASGIFNFINIYLAGTKGFVGLPKDYLFFPLLIRKIRKKVFLLLLSAAQKSWNAREKWEHANRSISPKSSLQSFLACVVS